MTDAPHGTYAKYQEPCHCDDCKQAATEYQRQRRGSEPQKVGRTFGTRSCYVSGCDHEECAEANRVYQRAYMKEQRDKKWVERQLEKDE